MLGSQLLDASSHFALLKRHMVFTPQGHSCTWGPSPPSPGTEHLLVTSIKDSLSIDSDRLRSRARGRHHIPNPSPNSTDHRPPTTDHRPQTTNHMPYTPSQLANSASHLLASTTFPPLNRTPHAFPFSTRTSSTCAESMTLPPLRSTPRTNASTRASVPPFG